MPKRTPAAWGFLARYSRMRAAAVGVSSMDMSAFYCGRRDASLSSPICIQICRIQMRRRSQGFKMADVGKTITVKQALAGTGQGAAITVRGWVRTRRDSKAGLSFVNLSDGSCFDTLQIVAPAALPNYASEVQRLTAGAAIVAHGTLVPSQGKGQAFELQADGIDVLGFVDDPETYPIQPKQHSPEFLREVAHLRPRTNLFGAISRVRHTMMMAIHRHLTEEGFFWVNTPIITTSDAEGAGDMFRVSTLELANLPRDEKGAVDFRKDFFAREAFLTVSGQLNVEAYCLALS